MRPIPKKLIKELEADPYYEKCARLGPACNGIVTWEHSMIYSNKQINKRWAILPLCWHHHLGRGLDKNINRYLALSRATDEDLAEYPKADFIQLKKFLISKYSDKIIS